MSEYIVSFTGKNGVKAYACGLDRAGTPLFTFAVDEATKMTESVARRLASFRKLYKTYFLHDVFASELPSGLDWQAEKI